MQETRVLHCRRADDDVADAVVEATLDRIEVTNAAAQLDRNLVAQSRDDFLDRSFVLLLAGERTVEIHDMQAARALFQPMGGLFAGRVGEYGRFVHQTLLQTNALPVLQVNRGNDQHFGKRK